MAASSHPDHCIPRPRTVGNGPGCPLSESARPPTGPGWRARRRFSVGAGAFALTLASGATLLAAAGHRIEQLTHGPKDHFFGYDGHQLTIPWSGDGRRILALETSFQDRMPRGHKDAAAIVLIDPDTRRITQVAETRAWNFQQGTMLYWNPEKPSEEFFFNDRRADDRVFAVLHNLRTGRRLEYTFPDMSLGNGNVAPVGGKFAAFNYGRVYRVVVSYPGADNFTAGQGHPENDGLFIVDVATGKARLIASYRQIFELLKDKFPELSRPPVGIFNQLFINHTYWSREGDRLWFVARWFREDSDTVYYTEGFTVRADGSRLRHNPIKLSHPDWDAAPIIMAGGNVVPGDPPDAGGQPRRHHILYDTDAQRIVKIIDRDFFLTPGEPAFSPDRRWIASTEGGRDERGRVRRLIVYHRESRTGFRLPYFPVELPNAPKTDNPLRIDMPPRWNRDGTKLLFEALADDGTRQLFVAHLDLSAARR
jgi:hypothetical protein